MSHRYLEYGKYPDQTPGYSIRCLYGNSVILNNSGNNSDLGSYNEYDEIEPYHIVDGAFRWWCLRLRLANLRAIIGQSPIILSATWTFFKQSSLGGTNSGTVQLMRFLLPPAWHDESGSATVQYRIASTTTWTHDIWGPVEGKDIKAAPIWEDTVTVVYDGQDRDTPAMVIDVTDEMEYVLRAGVDWQVLMRIKPKSSSNCSHYFVGFSAASRKPFFTIRYLNLVEFYAARTNGDINLEAIAIESDELSDSLYLGAGQRGETGTPVKAFAKNHSLTNTFDLMEIWDDFPEWTDPVHLNGSGTGNLDYVVLQEGAVSQRYIVNFYSATEYEIQALKFRDNTTNLHPTIDADSNWRGTTGTDFVAPEGGLTIPKECWQPDGLTAADDFEVLVLGNTTDSSLWAADSNDQVEITYDDSNSPDSAGWRPICGQRTRTMAAVTIDGTTKTIVVKPIVATRWTIGIPCWIGNGTTLDEGTIKSVDEASIGTATLTGTGADDITVEGNFTGTVEDNLYIYIDSEGSPDQFKWGRAASYPPSWSSAQNVVTGAGNRVLLEDGIYVYWTADDNHTATDYWTIPLTPFQIEIEGLTSGSNAYAVGSRVGTTLPAEDVGPSVHAKTNADSGVSEGQPARIYIDDPVTIGFTAGSDVTISNFDATIFNTRSIATSGVTSTYIELTADLDADFAEGSFVVQVGEGEVPFWLRYVIDETTTEELKQLRLNVRT